jgi:hypothetical protein
MEKPGLNHEINLIKSFVIKERQQRYTGLLSTEKGRSKFRSYIAHFKDLNSQYCTRLPASVSQSVDLYNLLKSKGAPDTCYIISSNSSLDRKELLLKEATETLFHSGFDYFLSCIPGKLAYFEGEELGSFYLLQK